MNSEVNTDMSSIDYSNSSGDYSGDSFPSTGQRSESSRLSVDLASTLLDASFFELSFDDLQAEGDTANTPEAGGEGDGGGESQAQAQVDDSKPDHSSPVSEPESEKSASPQAQAADTKEEPKQADKTQVRDINSLVEELRKKLRESEMMEYARQQGEMIEREIRQLAAAGIRVTREEAQMIIKEAFERGVEPYIYFKAYAADLLRNTLLFGEPLSDRPIRTAHIQRGDAPYTPPPVERRSLEERFRRPDGMISLDYFVAESMNRVIDDDLDNP